MMVNASRLGFSCFLMMTLLFTSILVAQPLMDLIDQVLPLLQKLQRIWRQTRWTDFLGQGLISGIGAVIVLYLKLLFSFLGSHCLKIRGIWRAQPRSLIGLSLIGLSGAPLFHSIWLCAIPAIMAARQFPIFVSD